MEAIKACRNCGCERMERFLDLGEQPFANSLLKTAVAREQAYPLALAFCPDCTLVQLTHTADPEELFSEYVWVTATSSTARAFARTFADMLLERVAVGKDDYVLEVASNDGTFLRPFMERGHAVLGVDPAANVAALANDAGVPTTCRFFGVEAARDVVGERGPAKAVFARNVLAHVAGIHDFVQGLHDALADDGLLAVEFHYAKSIFEGLQYDSVYHEHLFYLTLRSAEDLLRRHGLRVVDAQTGPISGGALILYCRKTGNPSDAVAALRRAEEDAGLGSFDSWRSFGERVERHRDELVRILTETVRAGGPVTGYGASARSSTLLNYCGIGPSLVSRIIDQSPLKQGLFTAGTRIPIVTREEGLGAAPGTILLLAWNFADEIMGGLKEAGFAGDCVVPLPGSPRTVSLKPS